MPPPSSTFDVDLDLDLDLGNDHPASAPAMPESTRPFGPPAVQPAAASSNSLEFDLSGDLTDVAVETPMKAEPDLDFRFEGLQLDDASPAGASSTRPMDNIGGDSEFGGDPMSRKLELADEFRQIGDMEGARDLLQEVIAKADGTLRSKAQTMLDELG
jgi:pilus assembly protein FimV